MEDNGGTYTLLLQKVETFTDAQEGNTMHEEPERVNIWTACVHFSYFV